MIQQLRLRRRAPPNQPADYLHVGPMRWGCCTCATHVRIQASALPPTALAHKSRASLAQQHKGPPAPSPIRSASCDPTHMDPGTARITHRVGPPISTLCAGSAVHPTTQTYQTVHPPLRPPARTPKSSTPIPTVTPPRSLLPLSHHRAYWGFPGPLWGLCGALLGPHRPLCASPWGHFGPLRVCLGPSGACLSGPSLGISGSRLALLGPLGGPL